MIQNKHQTSYVMGMYISHVEIVSHSPLSVILGIGDPITEDIDQKLRDTNTDTRT